MQFAEIYVEAHGTDLTLSELAEILKLIDRLAEWPDEGLKLSFLGRVFMVKWDEKTPNKLTIRAVVA